MTPWQFLTEPRGDRRWDLFLRATGIAAALLIPIPLLFPGLVPLVWLAIVGIPANGPLSPILPTAFDPLIIEVGKHAAPLSVTLVAVGIYMYTEFLNWHIYAWVLNWERMERFRGSRWVRWGVDRFGVAPITTIIVFAATPLPFWVVRGLAILHRYSLTRFMLATAVGRFPRFYMYAWLGSALSIPTYLIIAVIVLGGMVAIGARLARGESLLSDVVIDAGPDPLTGKTIPLPEDSAV